MLIFAFAYRFKSFARGRRAPRARCARGGAYVFSPFLSLVQERPQGAGIVACPYSPWDMAQAARAQAELEEEVEQDDTLAAGVNAEVLETAAGGAGYLSVRAGDIVLVLHADLKNDEGWVFAEGRFCERGWVHGEHLKTVSWMAPLGKTLAKGNKLQVMKNIVVDEGTEDLPVQIGGKVQVLDVEQDRIYGRASETLREGWLQLRYVRWHGHFHIGLPRAKAVFGRVFPPRALLLRERACLKQRPSHPNAPPH